MKKTIGVIGASGTLGRVVVRSLHENGSFKLKLLVRRPDEEFASLEDCDVDTRGVLNVLALDELAGSCDVLINLAAKNPEGDEEDLKNCEDFLQLNALGAGLVAASAKKNNTPLLHFSSVAVYETGNYLAGEELTEFEPLPGDDVAQKQYFSAATKYLHDTIGKAPVNSANALDTWAAFTSENAFPKNSSVYGLSKLIGEVTVLELAEQVLCVRMSDVYGPGHESRGVVTDHLSMLKSSNSVVVDFGFRSSTYFIFIKNVIRFIEHAINDLYVGSFKFDVVNLVGPRVVETEFANVLSNLSDQNSLGIDISVTSEASVKYDRAYSREFFSSQFPDFKPTSIQEGVGLTWDVMK